jgi:uncharacterized membrane protein YphA (DoxX/SURF4 family)
MTIGILVLVIGAVAFMLTLVVGFLYKKHKNWLMTFLQNFTGVLFVISGFVKAVDPLGTAYKMEQYFAEFETTFNESALSFLAPVFPWFSEYSLGFSIFMIVFEILLGLMLLLGSKTKLTAWAFLILVVFFTFLTGFTYLTGYVPQGVNFFSFSDWSAYNELQMKVTDCGCFGDFLKMKPKVSFLKDIVLLVPAIYFVFRHKDMHQLFGTKFRNALLWTLTILLVLYCMRNSVWNLPHTDFRPFNEGVNIATQKKLEDDSEANVKIISYELKNKLSGKVEVIPYEVYMKEFRSYPKTDWEIIDQVRTEPEVQKSKISDFVIYTLDGDDVTEDLLADPGYSILIISDKLQHTGSVEKTMRVADTTAYLIDTVIAGQDTSFVYQVDKKATRMVTYQDYSWDRKWMERYREKVLPIISYAKDQGITLYGISGGADAEMVNDFQEELGISFPMNSADDILLKTIIRSNPGIVLMKNGAIIEKWHYRKVPGPDQIRSKYMP